MYSEESCGNPAAGGVTVGDCAAAGSCASGGAAGAASGGLSTVAEAGVATGAGVVGCG